jgi:Alcohol dehydrogenase transcription factor Myb/SANT-like
MKRECGDSGQHKKQNKNKKSSKKDKKDKIKKPRRSMARSHYWFDEYLVESVQRRELLWNFKHADNKNKVLKNAAYEAVACELKVVALENIQGMVFLIFICIFLL